MPSASQRPGRGLRGARNPLFSGFSVDPEQENRADQRANEAGRLVLLIKAENASEKAAHDRADDTQKDRHDDATRILSGHDELGKRADHQTEDDPTEYAHEHLLGGTTARDVPSRRGDC